MQKKEDYHPIIIRRKTVLARIGWSNSTLGRAIKDGTFIQPIQLGKRNIGFVQQELDHWIAQKIAERESNLSSRENQKNGGIINPPNKTEDVNYG